jgi:hypothetical protein
VGEIKRQGWLSELHSEERRAFAATATLLMAGTATWPGCRELFGETVWHAMRTRAGKEEP